MNVPHFLKPHRMLPRGRWLPVLLAISLLLSSCLPAVDGEPPTGPEGVESTPLAEIPPEPSPTPFPTRPRYAPGELVDYTAQSGDTLPFLASRFNTTVQQILEANPFIPAEATTMPPGMPMKIPIYYMPLWGSSYQIIPDSLFVNGPAQVGFNAREFAAQYPGWINRYTAYVSDATRSGPEIVELVARNYSVSPRLLLAMLEYQSGALSQEEATPEQMQFPMGYRGVDRRGLFQQVAWAANRLNNYYYSYRLMKLTELEHSNERISRFDPWINSATASLHKYYNDLRNYDDFLRATGPDGLAQTYKDLFGDPWENEQPHIPGSLVQPEFSLPFEPGHVWAMTGGPHTAWGTGEPYAAIDFAPPSKSSGCTPSNVWATAVTSGLVVRSQLGEVLLDLDADGDERTGWVVYYLHVSTEGRPPVGTMLERGDPLGHPSCEGGTSTGTHVHMARKYNGEWIPAADPTLPFNLEGWVVHMGSVAYEGWMTRNTQTVVACTCSNAASWVQTDRRMAGQP